MKGTSFLKYTSYFFKSMKFRDGSKNLNSKITCLKQKLFQKKQNFFLNLTEANF